MSKGNIHQYAAVDYTAIERLQQEAHSRAAKCGKKLNTFQSNTKNMKNFNSRHRMNWSDSWDKLSISETQQTTNLQEHMESLFLSIGKSSFKTPADSLTDIRSEIDSCNKEIEQITNIIDKEKRRIDPTEDKSLNIPESIWMRFLEVYSYSSSATVAELIVAVLDILQSLQIEYDRVEKLSSDFFKSDVALRIWLAFIYNIWPMHTEKATLYGADLKKVLKNRGLFRRITDLNELDRLYNQLKQQQTKVTVVENQARNVICKISIMCDDIICEHLQNDQIIQSKIETRGQWNKHCDDIKNRLHHLRSENDIKTQINEEKIAIESANELAKKQLENQLIKSKRREIKNQVKSWQDKVEYQGHKAELYNEMIEFERRQRFQETLPILREAADRREAMRQRRIEERNIQDDEMRIEERRRADILDKIRAQVRVDVQSDPARLVKNTESWQRHILTDNEKSQLFSLQSFTDKQLMSDQRLRFQMLLRESNIPISSYAVKTMSAMQPATVPRRDTFNTKYE